MKKEEETIVERVTDCEFFKAKDAVEYSTEIRLCPYSSDERASCQYMLKKNKVSLMGRQFSYCLYKRG